MAPTTWNDFSTGSTYCSDSLPRGRAAYERASNDTGGCSSGLQRRSTEDEAATHQQDRATSRSGTSPARSGDVYDRFRAATAQREDHDVLRHGGTARSTGRSQGEAAEAVTAAWRAASAEKEAT